MSNHLLPRQNPPFELHNKKPFQVEGEPDPRFVIHVRTTQGSGSIAVGGAVGFPQMDFFEVTDPVLAAEIALRWNAYHVLQAEIADLKSDLQEAQEILE